MLERYFFDSSAILAFTRGEVHGPAVIDLIDRIKPHQRVTSVLVAYECFKGIPLTSSKRHTQTRIITDLFRFFTLKPVHEAQAMAGAKIFQYSRGQIDPILAAQALEGKFTMVTVNKADFERVPGLKLFKF